MSQLKQYITLISVFFSLTSCLVTENVRVIQVEVMKPGIFDLPRELKTIAIFNRNLYKSDTCIFKYYNGRKVVTDSTIIYRDLSNRCVDALSGFIKGQGYFQNVINYRDSLDSNLLLIHDRYSAEEYFKKSNADVCVFLNYYNIGKPLINYDQDRVHIKPSLFWSVAFNNDTISYLYNQTDALNFLKDQYPKLYGIHLKIKPFMSQAAEDLALLFGARLIPIWQNVERKYYRSRNHDMYIAEKYALNNEWLKAAEVWNKQTKSTNDKIAAKACYNMALACEMEGKLDAAIDWLIRSSTCLNENNEEYKAHKANCERYISALSLRKKEIDMLGKQVKNN